MDARWLHMQFQMNLQKTKADLSKALGLDPPAISKILAGSRQIKAQEYIKMRDFFGLGNNELVAAQKPSNSFILEPLGQNLAERNEATEGEEWSIPSSVIAQKTSAPPDKIRMFQIRETVMEPDFRQGEYVIVDLSDNTASPPGVFVISDGFGYMARHCAIKPGGKPPKIIISARQNAFEPQHVELDDIAIIGRIIGKMQWL